MTKRRICLNLALSLLLCLFLLPGYAASSSNLVIDGVEYSPTVNHTGNGWSYTYASGMGYLRLDNYTGGAIVLPCPSSVEYDGLNLIHAKEGENALYCIGDALSVGSSNPDAELTLTGGNQAPAIYGNSVSLWGWGRLYAFGGTDAPAVWGKTAVLVTLEQMVLSGGNQMAIATDMGGIIRVSGAHKYYAGMSAAAAVESTFYGGEFYLRAEPALAVITFDGAGGTVNGSGSCTVTLTVTTSGTDLSLYTPQREGYTFLGWNSEPDGSGDPPPPRLFSGGEMIYYALWEFDPILIPDEMRAQENAVIYAAFYYADGQLWQVIEPDGELAALLIPELPESGMRYAIFCVDRASYVPLTDPCTGPLPE